MFNALDIHMPDPEPLMRSPAKGRNREVAASWLTNPTVSSNLEAGNTPPFQGCVGLTCLKRLYEGVAGSPVAPFSCKQEKTRATGGQKSFIYLQHRFNESQVTLTSFILRNTLSSV
nr:FlmC family protein [Klebsiella pneumoniae subsp. pneumoniae]